MSNFINWLESLDQRRTVLVEVDYLAGGSVKTLFLANRPFTSKASDTPASTPYDDVILSGLTYGRDIGGQTSGSLTASVGSISLAASEEILAAAIHQFAGQQVRVFLGDQRWLRDEFQLVTVLTAEALEPVNRSQYTLKFRTERLDLKEYINKDSFTSGKNKDAVKPACFGICKNVKPVQVDDAGLVWAVHDGAVHAISDVRVNGASVSAVKDLANGTFTLSSKPSGTLTADVTSSADTSAKAILKEILNRLGNVTINESSLDVLPASAIGLYSRAGLTYRQALDAIAKSFGGFWGFTRLNVFRVGLVDRPKGNAQSLLTPDDILLDGVAFEQRIVPASEIELRYAKNYQVQSVSGYEEAYASVRKVNTDLAISFPDAEVKQAETLIVEQGAAEAEAERRRLLFSSPLKLFTIQTFAVPFAYEVGQEVRILYPYFGMDSGVDAIVLSINDDPLAGVTRLKVLING